MLKEIFTSERQFLDYFFNNVSLEEAEKVLHQFLTCSGMIVFSGVGKSGIIAEKLAKTLISTGTRAIYLPPTSALHGDIGILTERDQMVILSKSGQGQELIDLAQSVKRRGVPLMAWVSAKDSPLSRVADFTMNLPLEREICPFDLAPTTSTALQLIFGDVIAVALMRAKSFSLDQYALNHPAGAIGQLISQRVQDVMITGDALPICHSGERLKELLSPLSAKCCGCLLIIDEKGDLQGIFTDGDLRRALERHQDKLLDKPIGELMTVNFRFTTPTVLTSRALDQMENGPKIMMLPVLEDKKLVGLLHIHHLMHTSPSLLTPSNKKG